MTDQVQSGSDVPPVLEYGRPPARTSRRGKGLMSAMASLFVPGLGQYLAGRRARGVKWLVGILAATAVGLGLLAWPPGTIYGLVIVLLVGMTQLAMLIDAYVLGRRSDRPLTGKPLPRYAIALGFLVATAIVSPLGLLVLLYRAYAVQAFHIPGGSMAPEIQPDDRVICNKLLAIRRWDVVAFYLPSGTRYIKRVVGLPGETIEIRDDGQVYINDRLMPAPAGLGPYREPRFNPPRARAVAGHPFHLGPDEYFMMGDNSQNSYDSRYWPYAFEGHQPGTIPAEQFIGRVTFRYWPPNRVGTVR
jgi:signal peptidase I